MSKRKIKAKQAASSSAAEAIVADEVKKPGRAELTLYLGPATVRIEVYS